MVAMKSQENKRFRILILMQVLLNGRKLNKADEKKGVMDLEETE